MYLCPECQNDEERAFAPYRHHRDCSMFGELTDLDLSIMLREAAIQMLEAAERIAPLNSNDRAALDARLVPPEPEPTEFSWEKVSWEEAYETWSEHLTSCHCAACQRYESLLAASERQ